MSPEAKGRTASAEVPVFTPGIYQALEYGVWMFGWWTTLEGIDGKPVVYIWAGQIAG